MEALNIDYEYRWVVTERLVHGSGLPVPESAETYATHMVAQGEWVEDDGAYYTAEEWDSQYAEDDGPSPSCGCGANHWVHTD
jgi:hypothetical protein